MDILTGANLILSYVGNLKTQITFVFVDKNTKKKIL